MKWLPWILVILLSIAVLFLWDRKGNMPSRSMCDTIITYDTVRDTVPKIVYKRYIRTDTAYLPTLNGKDSIHDSVRVAIPIVQKEYKTMQYHAYVSGYNAALDSIRVFIPHITIRERDNKRWGLGVQVGYGVCGNRTSPYIGIGVNYNIFKR